jgi:hypothetical protein
MNPLIAVYVIYNVLSYIYLNSNFKILISTHIKSALLECYMQTSQNILTDKF